MRVSLIQERQKHYLAEVVPDGALFNLEAQNFRDGKSEIFKHFMPCNASVRLIECYFDTVTRKTSKIWVGTFHLVFVRESKHTGRYVYFVEWEWNKEFVEKSDDKELNDEYKEWKEKWYSKQEKREKSNITRKKSCLFSYIEDLENPCTYDDNSKVAPYESRGTYCLCCRYYINRKTGT